MRATRQVVGVCLLAVLGCACPSGSLKLPDGVTCSKTVRPGATVAELTAALAAAKAGECVIAAPGRYVASLVVGPGVTLAGETGTAVELEGIDATTPALRVGSGANVSTLKVVSAPGIGIELQGGRSQLLRVTVSGARAAGLVAWCEEDDCLVASAIELHDVELTHSAVGLLVHHANVKVFDGHVASNEGTSLASGYGVVASAGASLEVNGTIIETNQVLGLLVDGAQGTQAALQNVTVRNNQGRGVWAQGLLGSLQSPKLQLDACALDGNALAGLGARASSGISLRGGSVSNTALGTEASPTMPGVFITVGEGVGLFDATGDVALTDVTLNGNKRSQLLVDQGGARVSLTGGAVTAQGSELGVVVQNTTELVQAPAIFTPPAGQELKVSAPSLAVPTR